MAKVKTCIELIESLRECCSTIRNVADELERMVSSVDNVEDVKPTVEDAFTLVEVRKVLADLSRSGKTAEVRAMLLDLGFERLSDVPPTLYGEVIKRAEVMTHAG